MKQNYKLKGNEMLSLNSKLGIISEYQTNPGNAN